MPRVFIIVGTIFACVGLALLVPSGFMLASQRDFAREAVSARGTVLRLEPRSGNNNGTTYAAHVAFSDRAGRDHQFTEKMAFNPPRFASGERVPVLYDPASPARAVIDDFWGRVSALVIIGPMGLIFLALGLLLIGIDMRQKWRNAWLQRNGQPIEAEFLHVFRDTGTVINGDSPYRVVAQGIHPKTGRMRRFQSEPIWIDPTPDLQGRKITVLVDASGSTRHFIDLSPYIDETEQAR